MVNTIKHHSFLRIIDSIRPTDEVAPHRYTKDRFEPSIISLSEWKVSQPYQPGDVVYFEEKDGYSKALILQVCVKYDRFNNRLCKYRVCKLTSKGEWSRRFTYIYPGCIQRGYNLAGYIE